MHRSGLLNATVTKDMLPGAVANVLESNGESVVGRFCGTLPPVRPTRCVCVRRISLSVGSAYAREKRKSDQTGLVRPTNRMGEYCRGLTAHSTLRM